MTTASPCRKICAYDPALGWCRGCGRTLAEIGAWSAMDDAERDAVIAASRHRLGPARAAVAPPPA